MAKTIIFYDPSFPYCGERPGDSEMMQFRKHGHVVGARDLGRALTEQGADCFVHLHGPYFPKEAWPGIKTHLLHGKGLVTVGGAPFRKPVYEADGQWLIEHEQTAYLQELNIHEALRVDPKPIAHLTFHREIPLMEGKEQLFDIAPTYGLVLHVTKKSDLPHQGGSSGPMDAHIYPLLKGISKEGREVAAPVVLLENTKGAFAGGRWVLANQEVGSRFWSDGGIEAIAGWSAFCAQGVTEMWLKTGSACYEPGDQPQLGLQLQYIRSTETAYRGYLAGSAADPAAELPLWTFRLTVNKAASDPSAAFETVWQGEGQWRGKTELSYMKMSVPIRVEAGFYTAVCEAVSSNGEKRLLRQGFWGMDRELLRQGDFLSCDRDYFIKDGRPLPIVGMTYMTSDVARKFLFMPNPAVWDRDIAQMKKAGINLIRTGIWTAWRNMMFVDGHSYEEVLRAIDAFVLTAKRNDMEVTFNFFAFTPETWEGTNPYLDPRSVEAQKRFISSIVSRHAESKHIHWDLINEPTMFDPKRLWAGPSSTQDRYEREAFRQWLKERHGSIRPLQERWNMTPSQLPSFDAVVPPEKDQINFSVHDMTAGKKGTRWLDYTLFTMDMHNRWAEELSRTIRSISPKQMVTVGQDEALGAQRPSPLFYADSVDYTTVHSWWLMDQLVWDGIFAKSPHKPNLVQETGIMYVEQPNGEAKRSEAELRNILERKYAYAFSTGGAGAVQWIWNTNFYMNNVNESNIGALRADGTEKPEADVSYDFGSFMAANRDLFQERALEEVVAVFPYSNDFSNRKLAMEATSKLTRVLNYDMKVPFRAVGEYRLDALRDRPAKLIVVPSAHNVSQSAFDQLMEVVRQTGAVLLLTGPLGLDEYWNRVSRLKDVIGEMRLRNVRREELLEVNGKTISLGFDGKRIAEVNKEVPAAGQSSAEANRVTAVELGKGRLIWCPLPAELNERDEPLRELYAYALAAAGVGQELEWLQGGGLPGVYGRKLTFRDGSLFIFVSELGSDAAVKVKDPVTGRSYSFLLECERSVMFAADRDGHVTSVYRRQAIDSE